MYQAIGWCLDLSAVAMTLAFGLTLAFATVVWAFNAQIDPLRPSLGLHVLGVAVGGIEQSEPIVPSCCVNRAIGPIKIGVYRPHRRPSRSASRQWQRFCAL
jgi:hypothetical protein